MLARLFIDHHSPSFLSHSPLPGSRWERREGGLKAKSGGEEKCLLEKSAWHVPFAHLLMQAAVFFMRERHWKAVNYDCTWSPSASPRKSMRRPSKHPPVVARLRFHFPSSPRPTSFFILLPLGRGITISRWNRSLWFYRQPTIHRFVVRPWMDNDSYFSPFCVFFFFFFLLLLSSTRHQTLLQFSFPIQIFVEYALATYFSFSLGYYSKLIISDYCSVIEYL